jgi:hypothetical protein
MMLMAIPLSLSLFLDRSILYVCLSSNLSQLRYTHSDKPAKRWLVVVSGFIGGEVIQSRKTGERRHPWK